MDRLDPQATPEEALRYWQERAHEAHMRELRGAPERWWQTPRLYDPPEEALDYWEARQSELGDLKAELRLRRALRGSRSRRPRDSQKSKVYRAEERAFTISYVYNNVVPLHEEDMLLPEAMELTSLERDGWRYADHGELDWDEPVTAPEFSSNDEVQAYADEVTTSDWWVHMGGPASVYFMPPKIKFGGCASFRPDGSFYVQVAANSRWRWIVLHELAHVLTPLGFASHCPQYCGIYLTLVELFLGYGARYALAGEFERAKVKVQHAATLSEEQERRVADLVSSIREATEFYRELLAKRTEEDDSAE